MSNLGKAVRSPQEADPAGASFGAGLLTLLRVGWARYRRERSCRWSREQIERHQGNRLAMLRRFIEARSPFYRELHRGMQDRPLHELPTLSKATLMENFDSLVTDRRVEQAWGIRVFETYGATEYAPIAAESAFGNKHLFEDRAIIEIVDEQGRAVPPGERGDRILLTLLERRTQPMIRYEISDMVRELAGECACTRRFRMIESIEGRAEDILCFPRRDGRAQRVAIHPNLFHGLLETVPATGWQIVHDEQGTVHLTGSVDAMVRDNLRVQLARMLEGQGAHAPIIEVRMTGELQRGSTGKAPLIVSHFIGVRS